MEILDMVTRDSIQYSRFDGKKQQNSGIEIMINIYIYKV